jgi:hypothetical protein
VDEANAKLGVDNDVACRSAAEVLALGRINGCRSIRLIVAGRVLRTIWIRVAILPCCMLKNPPYVRSGLEHLRYRLCSQDGSPISKRGVQPGRRLCARISLLLRGYAVWFKVFLQTLSKLTWEHRQDRSNIGLSESYQSIVRCWP